MKSIHHKANWEQRMQLMCGQYPSGHPVLRIEPGGSFDAGIVFLGIYPAAMIKPMKVANRILNLPFKGEQYSFDPTSASGREFDKLYLHPLGLARTQVLTIDMMPFFFANTRKSNGRSMFDNIKIFEQLTGANTGIQPRPKPEAMIKLARSMPENLDRLSDYFSKCRPDLLVTLGLEAASFSKGISFKEMNDQKNSLFYVDPTPTFIGNTEMKTVHAVHPGLLMSGQGRRSIWAKKHEIWCSGKGRTLIHQIHASQPKDKPTN